MIQQAQKFAEEKFTEAGTKNHFMDVFQILQNEFGVADEDILIAGLLHDTLEDTQTTHEEIEATFSKRVADLVQEVSHPKNYTQEQRVEYYEHLKYISNDAKVIKLADFASHLRNFIKKHEEAIRQNNHKAVDNDNYITQLRNFLNSCDDSNAKNMVSDLVNRFEEVSR